MVNYSFYLDNSLYFHNILSDNLHLNYFGHLSLNLNKSLHYCRHLYNSFDNILDWNYFLDLSIINNWLFEWDIYNTINLSDLFYFHNLLNYSINCDNLWDFNYSFYNFLHNFLYFYNLGDNSEYFKYVINIYNSHNFLSDHTNDSFIHLWDYSCFALHLLKLFE